MAVPLGFSAGDIVAGISIASELYRTISSTSIDYENEFQKKGPPFTQAFSSPETTLEGGWDESNGRSGSPWADLAVLSLDGGGVRGYSSLLILGALMQKISKAEQARKPGVRTSADSPMVEASRISAKFGGKSTFLPYHYFDYIAGTSTGGLIAIMLGRLRMSVEDTLHEFLDITTQVYALRRRSKVWGLEYLRAPKKRSKERELTSRIESLELTTKEKSFRSDASRCRTIVCSLERDVRRGSMAPTLLRSYDGDFQSSERAKTHVGHDSFSMRVSEAALATSCASTYLKPLKFGGAKYYDAGVCLNNPSVEIFREVLSRHRRLDRTDGESAISLFLSIGCSNASEDTSSESRRKSHSTKFWRLRLEQALSTLSEEAHLRMKVVKNAMNTFSYYRFDAKAGLPGVLSDNDASSIRKRIERATNTYLQQENVDHELDLCAERLVDLRRERCLTSHWETFALGSRYRCRHEKECDLQKKDRVMGRDALLDHLRIDHDMPPQDAVHGGIIKTLVDQGRTDSD